jgi:hypothetical protein
VTPNGRELSGTPDERRKHLTLGPRGVGRSRESGVRSNSLLGGAQRRLILTTSGNNSRPLSGARKFTLTFLPQLDARRLPFGRRRVARRLTSELTRRRESKHLSPHRISYETRSRRSRPTICWMASSGQRFVARDEIVLEIHNLRAFPKWKQK